MSPRTARKGIPTRTAVRIRAYDVIWRAVEEGVAYGYKRAHKHTDAPGEESIREHIERAVMASLEEVLAFDDEGEVGRG